MGWEALLCLVVLGLVLAGLARNVPPDAVLLGALTVVLLSGLVGPAEAFAGFANTGVLTVGALYVTAAALRQTGALDTVGRWMLGRARTQRGALGRMAVTVGVMSAFLNNTPIVAMLIPVVDRWCARHNTAPSKLLIPLSYLCMLGGMCTLIGTSTNLVVNGLMIEAARRFPEHAAALRPMGLFELGRAGIPCALIGAGYLLLAGPRLLPDRRGLMEKLTDKTRDYLTTMRVEPHCRLAGSSVEQAGLRHLRGLFLIEIARGDQIITPVAPDQILHAGDLLTFTGVVGAVTDLERIAGLEPVAGGNDAPAAGARQPRILCEAVLSAAAPCVGKTIRDADFRAAYNAAVVAVHRGEARLEGKVGDIVLCGGDVLLLQTGPHFDRAHRNNPDFLLVSGVAGAQPLRRDKAVLALAILAALVVCMAARALPSATAALAAAGLMTATGCISAADARRSVDWATLIAIAAAFGLAKAMVNSGLVDVIAQGVTAKLGALGPLGLLAGVYLATNLFTETVTNNAAAALMFPFAVAVASQAGVNPRPFVMAVALAASASFATPLGYQTNLMIYGPGGYRFTDFVRFGAPLNFLLFVCALVVVPWAWPL